MATLTYPTTLINPENVTWSAQQFAESFQSPFNGGTQTRGFGGSMIWKASFNYPILEQSQFNILNPFMMQLRGISGRVIVTTPQYTNTLATGLTATTADTISVALSAPESGLNVGDYISINNELKMIVIKTDNSNYKVEPPFRQLYTAQAIELNNPTCIMQLVDGTFNMDFRPPLFQSASFDLIEALSV